MVFIPWVPHPWKPLSDEKIRDIRLFFAITAVTKMTQPGDSLLKSWHKFASA
jgi:hypothetical protein